MSETPGYYAIITANVRYDNRLTDSEKLMFAEITALSNKYGYCTASNGYFSKLYDVAKETISRRISKLNNIGYLRIEFEYEGKQIKQRKMYPIDANVNTPIDNSVNTPIDANVKENNTSINNININNICASDDSTTMKQFNEWWDLYDKKLDRKTSFTKFKSALKNYSYEQIKTGTENYLKTINDKKYQKHPKTFLHNESFLNDYSDEIKGDIEKFNLDDWL
ncbi:helix-turn-helix domain-containing protein [Macrococcoides goetzii]|nr:helix-turn-helix domain-containing protein [Macrococcus goetzii]TDM48247.1 helix-turn-helix domain-containing protein [Macrococcus goetzii]